MEPDKQHITNWPVICFILSISLSLIGLVCYNIPILNTILITLTVVFGIVGVVWFFYEIIKHELSNTRRRS
jgi:hypothetical protein